MGDPGINLNTVARAYCEQTDAGLLASARGRGTVVIARGETSPRAEDHLVVAGAEAWRNLLFDHHLDLGTLARAGSIGDGHCADIEGRSRHDGAEADRRP